MATDWLGSASAQLSRALGGARANGEGPAGEAVPLSLVLADATVREVLADLSAQDVKRGGVWLVEAGHWHRYDRPWNGDDGGPGTAQRLGGVHVAYGTPTRYEVTVYRATITEAGARCGWTVPDLLAQVLRSVALTADNHRQLEQKSAPKPFRLRTEEW